MEGTREPSERSQPLPTPETSNARTPSVRSLSREKRSLEYVIPSGEMTDVHRQQQLNEPVEILLVEDNPGDIRLLEEAFETIDTETRLQSITNGEDAVDFVSQRATAPSESLPDLALVDLSLPRRDGYEVLEAIRGESRLRALPVIMLTSSRNSEDVRRCYEAHANAYLAKPTDPEEFIDVVQAVDQFWFECAQLPPISA